MIQRIVDFLIRYIPSFLLAWLVAFSIASVSHTQFIVNGLTSVHADISFAQRLSMTSHDWLGLYKGYGLFIAIGLLIAFVVAAILIYFARKKFTNPERILYPLAGACALATILLSMEYLFNVVAIAGARGWGFYGQLVAGALGGWMFFKMTSRHLKDST